ncbi:MAG: ABC transporter permease [Pirellulales bacterium]
MSLKSLGIFGLLVALCVFMAVMTADPWYDIFHSTFLQPNNIENLLRRTAMYGILGIGVAFVIITGGIDLSIGSIVCLAGCLLALFLRVDYRAFDQRDVFQVQSQAKTIVVRGSADGFSAGDKVRFSGGRRAKNEMLTVVSVEPVQLEQDGRSLGAGSVIVVDSPLSRDDDSGQVAKVWGITGFVPGGGDQQPSVTISGSHPELAARDQVVLVHPQQGLKQLSVRSVTTTDNATQLQLDQPLGADFNDQWLAIPLQRKQRMSIPAAIGSVLGIAGLLGLIHGLMVTRLKLQPFVVTLCGLLIYRGLSRWLVNDQPVGFGNEFNDTLSPLGSGKWVLGHWDGPTGPETFGIPFPFFILLIAALVAGIFLNRTIWGRYLLALGRNEEAARYSGINTAQITLLAYIICTVSAAVGGMLFALDANSVSPSSFGNFFELYAIAAAVLGGCSLRGGEGTVLGVIAGTAVMQTLNNLILLMKISDELEFAIIGMVILIGVIADELFRRWAARRRLASSRG